MGRVSCGDRRASGKLFNGENLQVIVYGHTHQPSKEWRGEVLYFNPGVLLIGYLLLISLLVLWN